MRGSPEIYLVELYAFLCPRENAADPRLLGHCFVRPMNQALRFERLKEFNNIGKELGSGNREGLSQFVCDLINGMMRFQQLPNLQSDGIETEANPLLNIQQDGSVLRSGLPDTRPDHKVLGVTRIVHISPGQQTPVVPEK